MPHEQVVGNQVQPLIPRFVFDGVAYRHCISNDDRGHIELEERDARRQNGRLALEELGAGRQKVAGQVVADRINANVPSSVSMNLIFSGAPSPLALPP